MAAKPRITPPSTNRFSQRPNPADNPLIKPTRLFRKTEPPLKFAFVELHEKATRRVAGDFLRALAVTVPYKIQTVLTDNGIHFTEPSGKTWTPAEIRQMRADRVLFRCHAFEDACAHLDIEHRLTKPRHPWTNGQVERMNRTINDATVKRFH